MKTVYELVMAPLEFDRIKHDLSDNWAICRINRKTNLEFLEEISNAIEERLQNERTSKPAITTY